MKTIGASLKAVRDFFYAEVGPSTHLVLLVGPYGTGKTSIAQAMAQSLVEVEPPDWYILAPKPEAEALEFLPVNNYNIFYLFRHAELSRVSLKERLAQLRYYLPPHKNILINFAELNAAHPEEIGDRLDDLDRILRELREKALPKRILILMALNYSGLFGEFHNFLERRPDLVMGGARLSHVWLVQTAVQNLPRGNLSLRSDIEKNMKQISEEEAKTAWKTLKNQWETWEDLDDERRFLVHYLHRRLFGRGYSALKDYRPAHSLLIESILSNLTNKPGRRKEREEEYTHANATVRLPLWHAKATLYKKGLKDKDLPLPPILEEILQHSETTALGNSPFDLFLQAWGLQETGLALYLGTDPLVRLALRQGFLRNLNTYLLRELQLHHAERQAAERLAQTSGSPVSKYREILANSRLLAGMISYRQSNTPQWWISSIFNETGDRRRKKINLLWPVQQKRPQVVNSLEQSIRNNTKISAAALFYGHNNATYDGSFLFVKDNRGILLLVDVTHNSKTRDNNSKALPGSFECSNQKEGEKEMGKNSLWELGRKLVEAASKVLSKKLEENEVAIVAMDIAYQDETSDSSDFRLEAMMRVSELKLWVKASKEEDICDIFCRVINK